MMKKRIMFRFQRQFDLIPFKESYYGMISGASGYDYHWLFFILSIYIYP